MSDFGKEIRRAVRDLHMGSMDEIIGRHLKAIIAEVWPKIRIPALAKHNINIDEIPWKLLLSVP